MADTLITPRGDYIEMNECTIQRIPLFQFIPGPQNYIDDFVTKYSPYEPLPTGQRTSSDDSFVKIEVAPEISHIVSQYNKKRSRSKSPETNINLKFRMHKNYVKGIKNPKLVLVPSRE